MQTFSWLKAIGARTIDPSLAFVAAVVGANPASQRIWERLFQSFGEVAGQTWFPSFVGTILGMSAVGLAMLLRRRRFRVVLRLEDRRPSVVSSLDERSNTPQA